VGLAKGTHDHVDGVSSESMLVQDLCLLGVHGSLARAGKVKGQMPKVEKQEKKKKRTGRAKRRIQYNRRFVNVVQGFGRKRGPNADPHFLENLFIFCQPIKSKT